jgi:3-deoxy-7-phosphoheptulonate synthase
VALFAQSLCCSFNINTGLRVSRKLLLDLNEIGLPLAMEMLDTITPQFLGDLISWGAIGARTTESQLHRELVSGLSMPIGFKNGTGGSCKIAIDAIIASRSAHSFQGVTNQGLAAIVETSGNPDCHLVLRGADSGPNYERKFVDEAVVALKAASAGKSEGDVLPLAIMIDASHGNSNKDHRNQLKVVADVAAQLSQADHPNSRHIVGVMVESNLFEGAQKLVCGPGKKEQLKYGQSVTDACISWADTETVLELLAKGVQQRRNIIAGGKA